MFGHVLLVIMYSTVPRRFISTIDSLKCTKYVHTLNCTVFIKCMYGKRDDGS